MCTAVDRQTRCLLAWTVSLTRDADTLQPLADQTGMVGPSRYFSGGYEVYRTLLYRQGQYAFAPGKSETYSVEGDNADLRHYPTKALSGTFGAQESLFQSQFGGTGAASETVRVLLQRPAVVCAAFPKTESSLDRFSTCA